MTTPRVFRRLEDVPEEFGPSVLTIGNFDGVHVGHRAIFRRVAQLAADHGWMPSVLTFDPHPAVVVAPARAPKLLTPVEARFELMAEEGIRQVLVLPFTREIAALGPEEFVRDILVARLGVKAVLVGDNFRFGNRQSGDTRLLAELGRRYGFHTEILFAVTLRSRTVSSSEIRRLLQQGDVALAARFLARPYAISGEVVRGHGIGSRQTVPTLNLSTRAEVLPSPGVYITYTEDLESGRRWPSITNVGFRPTFNGDSLTIETFLLAPLAGDSPGRIQLQFLRRVREERKFSGAEELKAQILHDVGRAQAYFRRLERFGRRTCV